MEHLMEKFVSSKEIYNGKIIKVHLDTVLLPNNNEATREVVDHPGAVAVVPILDDGSIVLVKQYRYPVDKVTLEIPAGKLDYNEDPDDCVVRELREETGYQAKEMNRITSIYTAPGFSNEIIHIYIARKLVMGEVCLDEDEFVDVDIYKPEEIRVMINKGIINDAKTLTGLLLAGV
ncbi:ADP-ribose pyrophosphatase [bioreactor metagenome]|uniref:ADP-ribose pyrophosphatase n=1 Tax=bioreactor metagenome TaxID=1076179 RepID=A0A644UZ69_9ZZZZ|nr:NUDIX hydrolase [Negativicutes bacterium]